MGITQAFLIIHLLAISVAVGVGFSNLVGFRVARSLSPDMAKGIALHREALLPYGDALFVTIIASGLILLWSIGGPAGLGFWFAAKMAVVLIWAVTYVLMRLRIRRYLASRDMMLLPLVLRFAHVLLSAAALAIVFAVLAFAA